MKKSLFTTFLAVFSIILIMYLLLFIMMNSGQPLGGLNTANIIRELRDNFYGLWIFISVAGLLALIFTLFNHIENMAIQQKFQDDIKLLEENQELHMENEHLRERLEREAEQLSDEERAGLTKSRLNLENIYEDGFHVCNVLFGQRRVEDEACAFCLEVIYGERK